MVVRCLASYEAMLHASGWRTRLVTAIVALASAISPAIPRAAAASSASVHLQRFASAADFAAGTFSAAGVSGNTIALAPGSTTGSWTSPVVDPGFSFARLVASWNADTPTGSRVDIEIQPATAHDQASRWYVLGRWANGDAALGRTSVNGQVGQSAKVATDTLIARDELLATYQLRVTLRRASADAPAPTVRFISAVASDTVPPILDDVSAPSGAPGVELGVPALSQEIHARQYAEWGGGGEAWCSPTATEMLVEYWGRGPSPDELSWVDATYADPSVDLAARFTYDPAYRGTGNWPFNTAYAARYGLEAFVTQLRSLAEAEQFLHVGIPLVASIAAGPHELDGFLFSGGTHGHLIVIVGFDDAGNPVVNDPAATSDGTVRRVYDRGQLERAWLRGSAGIVYVIHPSDVPLPPLVVGSTANW